MRTNVDTPDPSRVRQVVRLFGYNAVILAILLVLVELGLHVFGPESILRPPQVEFGWPEPIKFERSIRADPDLLWVPRRYSRRVAAARGTRPSIAFMGDSCTNGGYESQLQSIIEERHPEADFTWVTLGVDGWSSYSGLQQLQRDVLPIRPRAVTVYYGWNDHWDHFGLQDKDAGSFFCRDDCRRSMLLSPRLVTWINFGLLQFRGRFANDSGKARVSPDDFRDNLRQMVRIAHANDIVPVLLTAPTSHTPGEEPAYLATRWLSSLATLVPLHRRYVQIVREVAAGENALLVDLFGEFDQLPRQDLESMFSADGIHPSGHGYRKIAELIDRRFDETGLYPRIM